MSAVNLTNVAVLDNPASFLNPFQFEISYECLTPLKDDLEWKLTYVGSAEDETYDQLLESVLVGPVNIGNYQFAFQADHPDPSKIREEDIIGVTVLLLTCSYMGQEFVRVGYYVNNDYDDEQLRERESPSSLLIFILRMMNTRSRPLLHLITQRKQRSPLLHLIVQLKQSSNLLHLIAQLKQKSMENVSSHLYHPSDMQ